MDTRTTAKHSLIGQPKAALDTPALVVDLDIMEANIARIANHSSAAPRTSPVSWTPGRSVALRASGGSAANMPTTVAAGLSRPSCR